MAPDHGSGGFLEEYFDHRCEAGMIATVTRHHRGNFKLPEDAEDLAKLEARGYSNFVVGPDRSTQDATATSGEHRETQFITLRRFAVEDGWRNVHGAVVKLPD